MKRKRRKRTRNDIAMGYRIESVPGERVNKKQFFKTLLQFLDGKIVELPEGWEITWRWQNDKKQKWREDEFTEVVSNSRSSFMSLMKRRLRRDLESLRPKSDRSPKRRRTKGKYRSKKKRTRRVSKVRKAKTRSRKSR